MRIFLLTFLLLVGLNQILARYVPWRSHDFEGGSWWNNYDDYSVHYNNGFNKFGIDDSSEESKEIVRPFRNHNDHVVRGFINEWPVEFGAVTPDSEENIHDDDSKFKDNMGAVENEEKRESKSSEENSKGDESDEVNNNFGEETVDGFFSVLMGPFVFDEVTPDSDESIHDDDRQFKDDMGAVENEEEGENKGSEENLKGGESDEVNNNFGEETIDGFFSALMGPFVFGEITPKSEESVDHNDDDDDNKIDNSSKSSAETAEENKSSEEILHKKMKDETLNLVKSFEEKNIDADINMSEKEMEFLAMLLSKITEIEYLGQMRNKSHKYEDEEILAKPVDEFLPLAHYLVVDEEIQDDSGERITTPTNDSGEGDDSNDDQTTTPKNDSGEDDDNYYDYDENNNFTTTESNNSEDNNNNNYRTTTSKNNSDEDDDQTITARSDRNEYDDEFNSIFVEFHGIDNDADSQQNLNNHKYEVVSSDSELTPTNAPINLSDLDSTLSSDDRNLIQEYVDILKDLNAQRDSLEHGEFKLETDFATIIVSNYVDGLNKFEKDIRIMHENLDKTKGYLNALQNLHSKIYLRKLMAAAIEEVQNKSKK